MWMWEGQPCSLFFTCTLLPGQQASITLISPGITLSRMTSGLSLKRLLSCLLLLTLAVMAPALAMAVPISAPAASTVTETATVTTAVTLSAAPTVTTVSSPTTPLVTSAVADTAASAQNMTATTAAPTSVQTSEITAAAQSPAAEVTSAEAAATTTQSPVSVPTILAGLGVAGACVVLARRHQPFWFLHGGLNYPDSPVCTFLHSRGALVMCPSFRAGAVAGWRNGMSRSLLPWHGHLCP